MTITMGQLHLGYDTLCRLLSARVGYQITREVVFRLRRQYGDRLHAPVRVGGNILAWDDQHLDVFENLIRTEDRCRH